MSESKVSSHFLGESPAIHRLRRHAIKLANAPFPILISGETGTGKYELGLLIHERSSRCHEPFIDVHCANLPETLFESILFGHEKGAFTDARERRTGKVEEAGRGTLLFDDVDCLSLNQQAKLLRLLERRRFERLGGTQALPCLASLLFVTNQNLWEWEREGRFRRDLLARVSWMVLHIPPLRERPEDVRFLARLFLEGARKEFGLGEVRWTPDVIVLLESYSWPGNVRELKGVVQAIAYLHEGHMTIQKQDVEALLFRSGAAQVKESLDPAALLALPDLRTDLERKVISEALRRTSGNRQKAARLLKIGRRTLQIKIAKYKL